VNGRLKFLVLLWVINIAFAVVLTAPILMMLSSTLDYSAIGDRLLSSFDYQWYIEFEAKHHDALLKFPSVMVVVGIIYSVIQTFLAGGLLAVFNSTEKKSMFIDFFYGCVAYFFRFFKVLLVALSCYFCLYVLNEWLVSIIDSSTRNVESEQVVIGLHMVRNALLIVSFNVINLVFDYTKVKIVVDNTHKTLLNIWDTVKFVGAHFGNTFGLYLVISIAGWTLLILYFLVEGTLVPNSFVKIFLVFLLEQIYIIAKIWIRMVFYGSQLVLYKDIRAELISAPSDVVSP
jgi:hypothetical protein